MQLWPLIKNDPQVVFVPLRPKFSAVPFTIVLTVKELIRTMVNGTVLKVSYFQNEFMKISFLPKNERKIARISALLVRAEICNFSFVFWEKR